MKFPGYEAAPDESGLADVSPIHGALFCRPASSSPVGRGIEYVSVLADNMSIPIKLIYHAS